MSFKLVYYSQQDKQWKNDILGFGDPSDTIGFVGCALASVAMLLSGHGYTETPKTLNQKLKNVNGFLSAGIVWGAVNKLYPNVTLKAFIPCSTSDAPLAQIDAAIAAGQPAIVQVDYSNEPKIQTHWVVVYGKKGDDYLMLDPWPYQTDITKEDLLMKRYARGNTLKRAISHVILYEAYGSGGPITTPTQQTQPTAESSPQGTPVPGGVYAQVKADVSWGLNIRSSLDTSTRANVLAVAPAGADLLLIEADGPSRIGGINQWVRVRDASGHEGYAAAWYLEKAPAAESTPGPVSEAPGPASTPEPEKLIVRVKSDTAKVYKKASKGEVVSKEKKGARLVVVEAADKAAPKIGMAGKWIIVKATNGKRGYIDGSSVRKG